MIPLWKLGLALGIGAAVICPLCESTVAAASGPARTSAATAGTAIPVTGVTASDIATDTATTRLHISGMTCGTCPVTARAALKRVPGVFSAAVTLPDSLGVVQYDPARVTAKQIAEQLTKLTGYRARILSDSTRHRATTGQG